jgi:DNA-binding response OmpR family regulator
MRILIVEDDLKIASFVKKGLQQAGHAVDHAADGEEALDLALANSYDAAVIDIVLPKRDGLSLIEELRRLKIDTPVVILSAKRTVDDRIRGLKAGGDDYITKPFSFSELLVRIQTIMRRASKISTPVELTAGDLSLNLHTREVMRGNVKIDLQPREFSLLEYLLRNKNTVLSKTMIMEHVWDYDFDPQTNIVDVLVSRLRSKIDRNFDAKMIYTMRGVGYVLKDPR